MIIRTYVNLQNYFSPYNIEWHTMTVGTIQPVEYTARPHRLSDLGL